MILIPVKSMNRSSLPQRVSGSKVVISLSDASEFTCDV